ncbi:MAG: hypothetical protein PHP35_02155 [Candidatus Colwellbacteria bacterium]|nr:hypothetical protein [Candidatus Colwellbacteria bacterium]
MDINKILEITAAVLALIFLWINLSAKRSLVGSFFKGYYNWIIVGTAFLFIGFGGDVLGKYLGLSEEFVEVSHHLALVLFAASFIYASYILPKEAAKKIGEKKV